jgi:hypothetical protein
MNKAKNQQQVATENTAWSQSAWSQSAWVKDILALPPINSVAGTIKSVTYYFRASVPSSAPISYGCRTDEIN